MKQISWHSIRCPGATNIENFIKVTQYCIGGLTTTVYFDTLEDGFYRCIEGNGQTEWDAGEKI